MKWLCSFGRIHASAVEVRTASRWFGAGIGLSAAAYAAYVGVTWHRYGRVRPLRKGEGDALLDWFMPSYDVVERHHTRVAAPAAVTFDAACDMSLFELPPVRAILKARELMLRAAPAEPTPARGLLASVRTAGWVVLAQVPGREIVLGCVTRPWEANVTFRGLPPDEFVAFAEPGYVKIAWTLRADPLGAAEAVFRSETRAAATDPVARAKFRRYWSWLSPGIIVIRWLSLGLVRAEARRRVHAGASAVS